MRRVSSIILIILGVLCIVPAVILLLLGLWSLISGDYGFTDAAPWWVIFFISGVVLGVAGSILLLFGRFISKKKVQRNNSAIK